MNELTTAQKLIGFLGCGVLSVGVVALLVVSCREQLLSVLERFSGLNAFARVMACGALVMLTMYGGAKHYMPTNTPPDDAVAPTNGAPQNANQRESNESPRMLVNRFASIRPIGEDSCSASISNWTARGAYCDWERVEFGDSFRFPVGTNFIDGVTLFGGVN